MEATVTFQDIQEAAKRIAGHVERTPCVSCPALAELIGARAVFVKKETEQRTGAFKERGALNKLLSLTEDQRAAGVVTASAGNHGQGVALHAKLHGIRATVCMPTTTPQIKVDRVRAFGAEICRVGTTFEEARAHAEELARHAGMTMVPPYDDVQVMAGQGTIAMEMLEQRPDIDSIVVQVGGGGLAAGIFTAARAMRPEMDLVACQAAMFPSLPNTHRPNVLPVPGIATIADGIAVHRAGRLTSAALSQLGIRDEDVVLAPEPTIERAIVFVLRELRTVAEGAGATGVAALLEAAEGGSRRFVGKTVGLVLSGGNIDPMVLSEVIQRTMARTGSLARITLELADRPGTLASATTLLGSLGANIVDIEHQRTFCGGLDIRHAKLVFTVETESSDHSNRVIQGLRAAGLHCTLEAATNP